MSLSSRHEDVLDVAGHGLSLAQDAAHAPDRLYFLLIKAWRLLRLVALESAALVLKDADQLAVELEDRASEAEVLRLMGVLHGLVGDLDFSCKNFCRSIELYETLNHDWGLADALGGLAVARWRQGELKEAAGLFEKSIGYAKASCNWLCAIQASANLANYFLTNGPLSGADAALADAERIYQEEKLAPWWGWALTLVNRAAYLQSTNDNQRAIELYRSALAICDVIGEAILRPSIDKQLSDAMVKHGDFKAAHAHLLLAYERDMANAARGRELEIRTLRGSFELVQEQRKRRLFEEQGRELELIVAQRTAELQREIEVRAHAEKVAQDLAVHDPLTGLPNRRSLNQVLKEHIERAGREGTSVGVLFVDVDQFSLINDTSGHDMGDDILVDVSNRLRKVVDDGSAVCRFGGDEFVVVVADSQIPGRVSAVVERIAEEFSRPFHVGQSERTIASSIGLARFPEHSLDAAQLIRFADIAMYSAKREKQAYAEFSLSMREDIIFRSDVEREFKRALSEGQFYLVFQPRVRLPDGELVGLEALARWKHPRHGELSPARFIPVLEETGQIREFGRWAIQTVCAQQKAWVEAGLQSIRVSVNVSQRQLQEAGFAGVVRDSLSRARISPTCLEIEITESTLLADTDHVVGVLKTISSLGVHIAIDDFGTGYSSLSLLSKLPFDGIKIDQSFIASMLAGASDRMIVQTVIRMGEALGKSVTAEGVETEAQCQALVDEGCTFCQGALFGMPEQAAVIEARMRS